MDYEALFDNPPGHTADRSMRWTGEGIPPGTIGMGTADLDYACPECVREACRPILEENCFNYRTIDPQYFDNLNAWYSRRYDLGVPRSWHLSFPGTLAGVALAVRAVASPGDAVIVQTPAFGPITNALGILGFKAIGNPLRWDGEKYAVDFDDFEAKCLAENVKAYVLVNPHNPTGHAFTFAELERLVWICARHGVRIISDEVHSLVTAPGKRHFPILAVSETARRISILLMAMSKAFNLMSLPHCFALVPDDGLRQKLGRLVTAHSFGYAKNPYCIAAASAVMSGAADGWLDALNRYIAGNVAYAAHVLGSCGIAVRRPEAGYLVWADCRGLGIPAESLGQAFLEAGVSVCNGLEFGPEGAGFVRLNVGLAGSALEEALRRIAAAAG